MGRCAERAAPAARADGGGVHPVAARVLPRVRRDVERLERAPRDITIMHPGPMNRGVEIDSRVADGPHSVILDQVTNGVAIRMAVLYLLAGGRPELADAAKRGAAPD